MQRCIEFHNNTKRLTCRELLTHVDCLKFYQYTDMAPKFPDEVDVFAVPHTRMKALVDIYMDQVQQFKRTLKCEIFLNPFLYLST